MAVVNVNSSFVYLANPMTASRATTDALLKLPNSIQVAQHHSDLQQVICAYPDASRCETVFHIVRHPCDWLISRFLYPGANRGDWRQWVKRRPPIIFNKFLGQTTDFGKYENLEADLKRLTGHDVVLEYNESHKTPGKGEANPAAYWDAALLTWARQHFQDFAMYHYE